MEKVINRETVLRKTNWGVDIYAHVLRKFYPGELVMKISGRDLYEMVLHRRHRHS